jgi:tetratricopeptide (TPR) repeat protein
MRIATIIAILTMSGSFALSAWASPDDAGASLQSDAIALNAAAKEGRCDKALPLIRRVVIGFDSLEAKDELKLAVWSLGAYCAAKQSLAEEAFADAREATQFPGAASEIWALRLNLGLYLDRRDDVVETMELLVHIRPEVISALEAREFLSFHDKLKASGALEQRRRFLAALARAHYQPPGPFDTADGLWLEYATILAEDNDAVGASDILSRIRSPDALLRIRVDNRFAEAVARDPKHFDLRGAAEEGLAKDRATAKAHPDLAVGFVAIAEDLIILGRAGEALDLLDSAQPKSRASAVAGKRFRDWNEQGPWLANEHAAALWELGRFEDSLARLREGATWKEDGADNVSQVINLSQNLVGLKRPAEALALLEVFGEPGKGRVASPYGYMQVMVTRACAFSQTGDAAKLKDALAYLALHEADSPATRTIGFLCANDLDGAAASYLRRLQSPSDRQEALLELSDFAHPVVTPPWDIELHNRARVIKNRADVRAAVAQVGHTEVVPLRPSGDEWVY